MQVVRTKVDLISTCQAALAYPMRAVGKPCHSATIDFAAAALALSFCNKYAGYAGLSTVDGMNMSHEHEPACANIAQARLTLQ